jgi:sterol desaturase/sphingolipid hydroxylase (fatty acid hydroxylase superfamily)
VVIGASQLSAIALAFTIRTTFHGVLDRAAIPYSMQFVAGFAALDLAGYVSHRLFHAFAPLWRVHQIHHSETDLDLTTSFRFHPVESLLSQGLSLATIALLGTPPGAVIIHSLAVILLDFFAHGNIRIPESADRIFRWLIITPAMHRVHHSEDVPEQNTNFGTVFSLWDRLFGTYHPGHTTAQARYGLVELANGSELNAARLLFLPFQRASKRS